MITHAGALNQAMTVYFKHSELFGYNTTYRSSIGGTQTLKVREISDQ